MFFIWNKRGEKSIFNNLYDFRFGIACWKRAWAAWTSRVFHFARALAKQIQKFFCHFRSKKNFFVLRIFQGNSEIIEKILRRQNKIRIYVYFSRHKNSDFFISQYSLARKLFPEIIFLINEVIKIYFYNRKLNFLTD